MEEQHKAMFESITHFGQSVHFGEGKGELLANLAELRRDVIEHFTGEENLMRTRCAPKFFEHRKAHRDFLSQISALIADVERDGAAGADQVAVQRMAQWLSGHIASFDAALERYYGDCAV
jgi:hemerythrin-like metal-binding protein